MSDHFRTMGGLRQFWLMIALAFFLSGCSFLCPRGGLCPKPGYALIIDAGSSGSRIYVYRVEPETYDELPNIILLGSKKVEPGISSYDESAKETEAGSGVLSYGEEMEKGLLALGRFAEDLIEPEHRKGTPLYVMATAGMRLLEEERQKRMMDHIKGVYSSGFSFDVKTVKVISGAEEGLYSWLAVNYLDDRFDPDTKREGMMEMGGASTQITFVPVAGEGKPVFLRQIRGEEYGIYSRSFLKLGQDQAKDYFYAPDCYPVGYQIPDKDETGTGDFESCAEIIEKKIRTYCREGGAFVPDCLFTEELPEKTGKEFVAFSGFYYTFKSLKIGGNKSQVDLGGLKREGEAFCGSNWAELEAESPCDRYLDSYCFNSAYFWSLLTKGYGFSEPGSGIITKDKIRGVEITWTLGALIDQMLVEM